MNFETFKERLKQLEVVGAGGAGFPAHLKLQKNAKMLLINGVECEPLLYSDKALMKNEMNFLIQGIGMLRETLNYETCMLCMKEGEDELIRDAQMKIFRSGFGAFLSVKPIPDFYPAGDEVVLLYEATGIRLNPGMRPSDVSCMIYNVETLYQMAEIMETGSLRGIKHLTVAGKMNHPGNYTVPLGMRIIDLLKWLGCTEQALEKELSVIEGGPMTGNLLSYEKLKNGQEISKTTNGLLILPKEHGIIARRLQNTSIQAKRVLSACSHCSRCTDLCPRFLLGHSLEPHRLMQMLLKPDAAQINSAFLCCNCGLCEVYACHQDLAPATLIQQFKKRLADEGLRYAPGAAELSEPSDMRWARKVPSSRLKGILDVDAYDLRKCIGEKAYTLQHWDILKELSSERMNTKDNKGGAD